MQDTEPASPGSYGQAPPGFRLPPSTRLGPVRLQIADIQQSLAYYEGILGFRVLRREDGRAVLSAHQDEQPLVELVEHSGARPAPRQSRLGLYHFAILLPHRAALGAFLRHLEARGLRPGLADHLVSEAAYLYDPDGLGIEVYADRPQSAWCRRGRELEMTTDPADVAGLLAAADGRGWDGMPAGTVIGHVHLHVGDLERSSTFYHDALGFDRTVWSYPGALFLGAGGYHHHLGTNIWAGPTASAPGPNDAQLLEWTIEVPGTALEGVTGQAAEDVPGGLVTRDPWGTQVRVVAAVDQR